VAGAALKATENGGKLFSEYEEPAVGGRLLIAQSVDEAAGCKARAGDAGGEPRLVYLSEETGDLIPAGAFAGFAGIAYEDDIEVQTVTCGVDHAVGSAADQVAEDREKLEENGGWMGFGVGSHGADGESGDTVESGLAQVGIGHGPGRGDARCLRRGRWFGGLVGSFWLRLAQEVEEFGLAFCYVGIGGHVGPAGASGCLSNHDSTLLRFRNISHGGRGFCCESMVTREKLLKRGEGKD
jgi:hypothetical protein